MGENATLEGMLHNVNLCRTSFQKNLLLEYQLLFTRQLKMFWLVVSPLTLATFWCYSNVCPVRIFPSLPISWLLTNRSEPPSENPLYF